MRPVLRRLTVFAITGSILLGLCLPFAAAAQPFDADAHQGLPVPAEHAKNQFETPGPVQPTGHCLICHWWLAIGTVVVRARVTVATPAGHRVSTPTPPVVVHDRVHVDIPSLRGPPRGI